MEWIIYLLQKWKEKFLKFWILILKLRNRKMITFINIHLKKGKIFTVQNNLWSVILIWKFQWIPIKIHFFYTYVLCTKSTPGRKMKTTSENSICSNTRFSLAHNDLIENNLHKIIIYINNIVIFRCAFIWRQCHASLSLCVYVVYGFVRRT